MDSKILPGIYLRDKIELCKSMVFRKCTKGQLIFKVDGRAVDSTKKGTDEFVLFAFFLFTANKSNSSVRFLGESTARQSALQFHLTFNKCLPYFREKFPPKIFVF